MSRGGVEGLLSRERAEVLLSREVCGGFFLASIDSEELTTSGGAKAGSEVLLSC
jgi:hypothetical protein